MNQETKKRLKQKGRQIEPIVRVGKNGLTATVVEQINKAISKKELIKIKFLKSFLEQYDKKESANKLANLLEAELIDQVGFNAVLYKRANKRIKTQENKKRMRLKRSKSKKTKKKKEGR